MKRILIAIFLLLLVASLSIAQEGKEVSVRMMPPVVIKTFPVAGDTQVDPALKEIRVTFSKNMMTNNQWSWVMYSKDTFPETVGDIKFLADKRTNVLPVKLEAGKTYVIWLNQGKYNNFKDESGQSAVPYLLVFQTRK